LQNEACKYAAWLTRRQTEKTPPVLSRAAFFFVDELE
jgi:hypothetical protein